MLYDATGNCGGTHICLKCSRSLLQNNYFNYFFTNVFHRKKKFTYLMLILLALVFFLSISILIRAPRHSPKKIYVYNMHFMFLLLAVSSLLFCIYRSLHSLKGCSSVCMCICVCVCVMLTMDTIQSYLKCVYDAFLVCCISN